MHNTLAVRFNITTTEFTRAIVTALPAGWKMVENFSGVPSGESENHAVFKRANGDAFYLYKDENRCSVSAIADTELEDFNDFIAWVGNSK